MSFQKGDKVKMTDEGFQAMVGVIENVDMLAAPGIYVKFSSGEGKWCFPSELRHASGIGEV